MIPPPVAETIITTRSLINLQLRNNRLWGLNRLHMHTSEGMWGLVAGGKQLTLNLIEVLDTLFYDLTSQKHYPAQG